MRINKDKIHFSFDKTHEPVLYAQSGNVIEFDCQDCYCEQIKVDHQDFSTLDMARNNPATGPLYIHEAMPGDVLCVEILDMALENHGVMCARKGAGIYNIEGSHCRKFDVIDGMLHFDGDIEIPLKPMIGVIGTAPNKPESTQSPGEHGGNLDIKDLGVGSKIYLPVNVEGALLSMGDIHGIQGDGETVICALEMGGLVKVKVDVIMNVKLPTPLIVTEDKYITTSSDESLDIASVEAANKMHAFIQQITDLSDLQCGLLLSMLGDLRISQVVNPKKGCMMSFPIGVCQEKWGMK